MWRHHPNPTLHANKHCKHNMSRPGGLGAPRPADDEVNVIVASVKADLENKAGRTFAELKPVSYATQVGGPPRHWEWRECAPTPLRG